MHTRIARATTSIALLAFLAALLLTAVGGWVANIVKLFGIAADPITGMFILRCVGVIFAPLGAILGFL